MSKLAKILDTPKEKMPQHVAIIMDGNRRWAKEKSKTKIFGHRQGANSLEEIINASLKINLSYLTVYAFSTENWSRDKSEINELFSLLNNFLDRNTKEIEKKGIKLNIFGELSKMPDEMVEKISNAIERTKNNNNLYLNIALNYGAREEIVKAVKSIIHEKIPSEAITKELFSKHLYSSDIPDPDLLIRTSGELRISNFLLWQIAYSELYFTDILWPNFKTEEFYEAILNFSQRKRRYGS